MATILVVDDVAANREFLVTLLRQQGHRLLEAADGHEGLSTVRAEHPDIVITDVLMPVMDGDEFVRQLRLDPATSSTPVVFHTPHYGGREARALAQTSGVSWVLTKPALPDDVLKVVSRVLAGESGQGLPRDASLRAKELDREHLRLLTDKLTENAGGLRTANARLRALINIGLELASERNTDRLLQSVCIAVRDLFGATYVALGVLDLKTQTVRQIVTHGAGATDWIKVGDPISGILGTVVAERRTVRGDNSATDPAGLHIPALHPTVKAYLAAPLASPDQVYGWICLVGNEGRAFSEDDEDLVLALSGQVGRIYETGHFYALAQHKAEELEHEILERTQAESDLREARDRAQQYLDTAQVMLVALDLRGRIVQVNPYACSILEWPEQELLGRDWIDTCLPARIREECQRQFHAVVSGGLPRGEHPILAKSGTERLIEWRNTLLRDDQGHVVGAFSSGTDISERNQAEEARRTAEDRTRFALRAAGVGIWDMDYTTGVLQWSDTLEAQYGYQPGTFGGTFESFVERIHPNDRASVVEVIANAVKSGSDFTLQHRSVWPDGTTRWLNGAGRIVLGEDGQPVRGVGISLDVTERRKLEEQSHQAQKMEAIGRLAGGVAHDFNNLLTVILGHCELLLADLDPADVRGADIAQIQKAGASAAGLTRQLLAFSRKEVIEPTRLDLNELVSGMLSMVGRLIGEDVKVVLGLEPELAGIQADRGQVEQIVLNLSVNARDAMPKGGTLMIGTANVQLDEHYARTHFGVTPGRYVALSVSDTGTGMEPEVQARLFEPFFTTKERGRGTGLGLATVHAIATRSGGSVNVHSEIDKGTSFSVYFPSADPQEIRIATPTPPPVPSVHRDVQTVLVVEDSEALRELARRLLQQQGYTVLVAADADAAVALFEQNTRIDVLLTDVVMPGASGPDLTRRLVERWPALRVIYMSGYTDEAIAQHGVLQPGIAFLQKPFTSESLGKKIREVAAR